jgi:hypothetical protein
MQRRLAPTKRGLFALATVALAAAALTSGCSLLPPDYTLHVSNSTTLPLTLVVNDQQVAVLEPGTSADVPSSALPALPWEVATRTVTGRSVATMDVAQGSIVDQRAIDGTGSHSAPAGGVALSCGRIMLWVGSTPPSGGAYSEGVPGDCEP